MSLIPYSVKIVKFLGGLGNQMFQYAFYLSLKEHFDPVKADLREFETYSLHEGYELEKVFGIHLDRMDNRDLLLMTQEKKSWFYRKLRKIHGTKNVWYGEEKYFSYDPAIYKDKAPRYYWGYWQHVRYHKDIRQKLRKDFSFLQKPERENGELVRMIQKVNSVAIHVRRGDYVGHAMLGEVCGLEYYQKAIRHIKQIEFDPVYFVFSNDMDWCKEHLGLSKAIFVEGNNGEKSFMDMQLMSLCKHQVIANSSFSWWAAWLNVHPEKVVIAPKTWTNEPDLDTAGLYYNDWILL